ncbi:MAG: ATP-binding protein [Solobacterium sp.]|nr:ATP-binding protein [Solobacterium sp.]
MLNDVLVGRNEEIQRLNQCMNEERSQLVVVYGRRRVGKTYLINKYFNGCFDFKLTGIYNARKEVQLQNFVTELNRQGNTTLDCPKSWAEAFSHLRTYIEELPEDEKHVIFFDEMPWLDTAKSEFLPSFEFFWNDYGCTVKNLVCIVCGSATAWMEKKIAQNKGGLFNRQTCSLFLKPFTLKETEEYLVSRGIVWSHYDISECYMILGGIPFYQSLLRSDLSLSGNIDNLFFRKRAELWDEFDHLYQTLFNNSELYIKTVEALSSKRGGLTRKEISEKTGIYNNSSLTEVLDGLAVCDFIRKEAFYGNHKRELRYQLSDYYTAFYFHFLKDKHGRDEHFWSHSYDNPARRAWTGLTFELLCKDHIRQIKQKLGISGVLSEEYTWSIPSTSDNGINKGAQIDLLIDRRDHVINLCEIKFVSNLFEIDKSYNEVLRNKIEAFSRISKAKKSLQLTIISPYGVKDGKYSNIVTNQVLLDDLFL